MADPNPTPLAGGCLLAAAVTAGAIIGVIAHQPSIGIIAGAGIGIGAAVLVLVSRPALTRSAAGRSAFRRNDRRRDAAS